MAHDPQDPLWRVLYAIPADGTPRSFRWFEGDLQILVDDGYSQGPQWDVFDIGPLRAKPLPDPNPFPKFHLFKRSPNKQRKST